jgi:methyl-galactoside transport system substrate-binding protein
MKKIFSLLLAGTMALGLTACSSSTESTPAPTTDSKTQQTETAEKPVETTTTDELPSIGVTIYKYDDNFMAYTRSAIEKVAKNKATLIMNDSQNDQSKQNDQVDAMLAKGVKALMINLVDPGAAPAIAEKAKAVDVPVIFFNKEYPDGTDKIDYDKVWYVGTTSAESGEIQGELIATEWKQNPEWDKNGDGKMQYVMLMGEPGHPDAEARTKESVATIVASGIEVEELANQTAMWDASRGKELMETWLAAHGDKIEMVICNNDSMALGAVEALKAAGYFTGDKYLPVVGVDALPEALELIKSGQMLGTVLNDPLNQGKATLELAVNVAKGLDPLEGTDWELDETKAVRVPYVAITLENLGVAEEAYGLK